MTRPIGGRMTYANHVGKWHDLSNAKFHVLMGVIARFTGLMLIIAAAPAGAATVSAHYFAFEPEKRFFDGDDDTSSTRSRAVVDSGFVHVPIFNKGDWVYQARPLPPWLPARCAFLRSATPAIFTCPRPRRHY